ncbi:MAG: hypothetical protein ACOY3Z_06360 [Thermodesulfobacteriota bacterium]
MPDIIELPEDALPSIEELPGDLCQVAEIIAGEIASARPDMAGVATMLATRATFALANEFRGAAIYCHNLDKWFDEYRNSLMRSEFDRRTAAGETATRIVRDLAAREWLGSRRRVSERTVWAVLGRPDDRQMRIF